MVDRAPLYPRQRGMIVTGEAHVQARAHSRKKLHAPVLFLAQNMFAAARLVSRVVGTRADPRHPERRGTFLASLAFNWTKCGVH